MDVPAPGELMARIAALPAAGPLLERLGSGPAVYLVGGAVRDLLRGGRPLDLDLAVEADPVELAASLGGEVRTHGRFGTCTVAVGEQSYDFARTRRERYAHPGALPDVEPAPIREDLARRDFTVNAMAIALAGPRAGELIAVPGALEDLEHRRLRVLHGQSFLDDPTRLLRMARYAARLEFEPEAGTDELARTALAGGALGTVSPERVGTELRLAAREPDPVAAFGWLRRLGIDEGIEEGFGLAEADAEVAARGVALLGPQGRRDRLVLAAAGRGVPGTGLAARLDALGFTAPDREAIVAAASEAEPLARALAAARSPSEIARAAGHAPVEAVALAGALGPAGPAREWLERLRFVRLSIDGDDLVAAGVVPGPAVGRGLRAALAEKLDGRTADRASELEAALAAARARDGGERGQ